MPSLVRKLGDTLQREGVLSTAAKVLRYPFNRLRHSYFARNVLELQSVEDRFTWIYRNHHWRNDESVSGLGSTLAYTENLRKELPKLLAQFSIKTIFDAPCGDFNWMRRLLPTIDVDYIGGDIVLPLIESHNKIYKSAKVAFVHIDLIKATFPKADLMICRDCLFHLSYEDTKSVLRNFVDSGIPYLLTTTHKKTCNFTNKDIQTGYFRLMDLSSPPYNLPANPLATIDDWIAPDPERQMSLWSREQVSTALAKFD